MGSARRTMNPSRAPPRSFHPTASQCSVGNSISSIVLSATEHTTFMIQHRSGRNQSHLHSNGSHSPDASSKIIYESSILCFCRTSSRDLPERVEISSTYSGCPITRFLAVDGFWVFHSRITSLIFAVQKMHINLRKIDFLFYFTKLGSPKKLLFKDGRNF